MKTEFGRKIRDGIHDCGARAGFSVRVPTSEIFLKVIENLLELAHKILVLCKFFQPRLPRKLQHSHGIMIGATPKLEIEFPKQSARGWLPSPPKIETHLPQWLQRRRQDR